MAIAKTTEKYKLTLATKNTLIINRFQFKTKNQKEGRSGARLACFLSPGLTVLRHSVLESILSLDGSLLETIPPVFKDRFQIDPNASEPEKPNNFAGTSFTTVVISLKNMQPAWLLTDEGLLGFLAYRGGDSEYHTYDVETLSGTSVVIGKTLSPLPPECPNATSSEARTPPRSFH